MVAAVLAVGLVLALLFGSIHGAWHHAMALAFTSLYLLVLAVYQARHPHAGEAFYEWFVDGFLFVIAGLMLF